MRKICVVTGSRAEYGLLYWLMKEIEADTALGLQVVVCAMHLSPEFGLTWRQVKKDGFPIEAKIEMLLSSDSSAGIAKSIGLGVIGFADAFERLQPDMLVLLGDRFEMLAAAQAAMAARIPIAHLHGGELTEGVIDEAIRHAITKMAHFHFVSAEVYRHRVIQMGEQPDKVFNVGATGLDNIRRLKLMERAEFEQSIGMSLGDVNFLVTYHPVTLDQKGSEDAVNALLSALNDYPAGKAIFTQPNADTGGRVITELFNQYVKNNRGRAVLYPTMGQLRYLSALKHMDIVIGNSSSGIIEAPSFGKATVNIGSRQRGRLRSESVIDCGEDHPSISSAIRKGLSKEFRAGLAGMRNLYGDGTAAERIKQILKVADLDGVVFKRFHDVEFHV